MAETPFIRARGALQTTPFRNPEYDREPLLQPPCGHRRQADQKTPLGEPRSPRMGQRCRTSHTRLSRRSIATHANAADWECWAALDTLAAMTRHNERTVRRKIAALESLGVVSTRLRYDDRGYRTTSAIKLNRPEPVVEADETRAPPTGHFSTAYRTPLPGPNEYLEERKNSTGRWFGRGTSGAKQPPAKPAEGAAGWPGGE